MNKKLTATMLIATALPFSKANAHTGSLESAPISAYMYFMIAVGVGYSIFLIIRMQRRSNKIK